MFLDNLEDAIMFSKLNTLHNSILSNIKLKSMLNYLSKIYNRSEIPNFSNVLSYYQFLGVEVTFSETKIIFAIHIPILRHETLSFYHIYPVILNRTMFLPKYPYMAQGPSKRQFAAENCPMDEKYTSVKNCFSHKINA